jgi:hypothetical protein
MARCRTEPSNQRFPTPAFLTFVRNQVDRLKISATLKQLEDAVGVGEKTELARESGDDRRAEFKNPSVELLVRHGVSPPISVGAPDDRVLSNL